MENYYLKINDGEAVSFESFGVLGAVLTVTTWARDVLTLTVRGRFDEPGAIPAFAKVELLDGSDGVCRFVGWLDTAPRRGTPSVEGLTYTLNGAYRWLMKKDLFTEQAFQRGRTKLIESDLGGES